MQSLSLLGNTRNTVDGLLGIQGAVRSIVVVSAYFDIQTIDELISFTKEKRDQRVRPTLRIFVDYSSSGFGTRLDRAQELVRCASEMENLCCADSGIYLVRIGGLFHSKLYLVEGNREQRLIVGSMNATQNALTANEELIVNGVSGIGANSYIGRMAEWVNSEYLPLLISRSIRVTQDASISAYPSTLRQLLLDGWLYYDIKEQDPFRFPLNLPEDILESRSALHPLLSAMTVDAVSVVDLVGKQRPDGGLGRSLPPKGQGKESWRRYCIETCYGLWSPTLYDDEISRILTSRIEARRPFYDELKKILQNEQELVTARLEEFAEKLNARIESDFPVSVWDAFRDGRLTNTWSSWYATMLKKLENEEHYNRIISGVSWASVPDVWNDPIAAKELEDSFLGSLKYYWSKSYSARTNKAAAAAVANNLLDMQNTADIENDKLKKRIEKWCKKNQDRSIFEL